MWGEGSSLHERAQLSAGAMVAVSAHKVFVELVGRVAVKVKINCRGTI